MRFSRITGPLIGSPKQKISEIDFRLFLIAVTACLFVGVAFLIKWLYHDSVMGDVMVMLSGILSLLPLSLVPSYITIRRNIKTNMR